MVKTSKQLVNTLKLIRPEDQLLLYCARTSFDSATVEQIQILLRGAIDWDYLIRTAYGHGIKPLLCHHFSSVCTEALPETVRGQLQRFAQVHSLQNLFMTRELTRISALLENNGVCVIPWKGPVLAATAYGDIALRQFGDLDILVRERDARPAKDLLLSSGYRPLYQPAEQEEAYHALRKVYELVREDGRVVVELHWAITSQTFHFPLDPDSLWEQVETVSLEGAMVRNLSPGRLAARSLCPWGQAPLGKADVDLRHSRAATSLLHKDRLDPSQKSGQRAWWLAYALPGRTFGA